MTRSGRRGGGGFWSSSLFVDGVVGIYVYAGPGFLLGPGLGGGGPEFVGCGKAQGEPGGGAEVEAAGGDVGFADAGLVAGEADGEPTFFIEGAGGSVHARHDRSERAANLRGVDAFRELMAEGDFGEVVECAVSVGE